MPINYLAHYQIGGIKPQREFTVSDFLSIAQKNKVLLEDVKGIELRVNGHITKHGNIVDGPTPDQVKAICEFAHEKFELAYFHLSEFGLDLLLGDHNGRKVDEDILDNFDRFVGHYKQHDDIFGQVMSLREVKHYIKSRASAKRAFRSYLKECFNGDMTAMCEGKLLVENGYFARNSITAVYNHASYVGARTTIDMGHIHRSLFDSVPNEKNASSTECDPSEFLRDNGTFKTLYIGKIGDLAKHLHFHWIRKETDPKTGLIRVKDHEVFNLENTKTFDPNERSYILALTDRFLNSANNAATCTIELEKNVNTPENVNITIDNLIKTFGSRFNPA